MSFAFLSFSLPNASLFCPLTLSLCLPPAPLPLCSFIPFFHSNLGQASLRIRPWLSVACWRMSKGCSDFMSP